MPTVIDSLIVKLGLDPKAFNQGQEDALAAFKKTEAEATRTAKEMEARGKQAGAFFSKIRNQALALTAVLLGGMGLKSFVQNTNAADQAVGRLAKNLNISTEELSAWEGVAKRFGSSAEDIDGAFRSIQSLVSDIKNGIAPDSLTWLQRAGVDMTKFLNDATSNSERMKMLSTALGGTTQQNAQFFGAKAGFSEQTVNMLRETGSSIDDLLDKQKKMNVTTAEDARLARERTRAWQDLEDTFSRTAKTMLQDVTPAILAVYGALKVLVEFAKEHLVGTEIVVGTLTAAFAALSVVRFAGLIASLGGVTGALAAAATAAGSFVAIISGGAIGAVVGAGANWLIDKATGGQGAGSWLFDKLNKAEPVAASTQASGTKGRIRGANPQTVSSANWLAGLENKYSLPPGVLDSMWAQESGRGKNMLSPAGAKGHMGFMDPTAREYGLKDPNNFEESTDAAARKMRDLLKQSGGSLPRALAAYNSGTKGLNRSLDQLPLETQKYVPQIMGRMNGQGGSSSSSSVSIGNITVVTQATDAKGIAKDIGAAVKNYSFGMQVNPGLL